MEVNYFPFTELLSNIVDNRGRTCPTSESGFPLIATNCIRNDLLYPAHEKVRYVSNGTYKNWFRGHPEPGDLIFVTKGSPGRVCMVPNPVDFCIAQDMVAIRANEQIVTSKFLLALLRSVQVQKQIENMHVGTLIPHFKKGDFENLILPIPDWDTQNAVGEMYFTISSKIELNRRMNATLEATARALFKSWFVDFDPVRAKMEGRETGLPEDIDALFPAEMEDGRPKGWGAKALDEIATYLNGLALQKYPPNDDEYLPVIKIAQLRKGNTDGADRASTQISPEYIICTTNLPS